jgi:hypothetical protein
MPPVNRGHVSCGVCRALTGVVGFCGWLLASESSAELPGDYRGVPYHGTAYAAGAQAIPGRIQCEYYDLGGEGVAYHDEDGVNSGSGGLNPADGTRLNSFRMAEAVDISYTKFRDSIDDNPFNLVRPEPDQLYVGWTAPGEWVSYTVRVSPPGTYAIGLMYTSNGANQFSLSLNNRDFTGPLTAPTANVAADPLAWRQWHHWNRLDDVAHVALEAGTFVLTLRIVAGGNMNFDYLEFRPVEDAVARP